MGRRRRDASLFCLLAASFTTIMMLSDLSRGDLTADGQALLAFLDGLDAAPRVAMRWSNTSSPCTWLGVSCNAEGDNVVAVKLPGVGLYGSIRIGTLGLLPELQLLSLRSNKLSGPLPADLLTCAFLRKITLQHNLLSGPVPAFSSYSTPWLSVVDLSFNNFSGSIPAPFVSLSHLKILFLQNNSFSGPIPQALGGSSSNGGLAQLDLSNNRLNGSVPAGLRRFSRAAFGGNAGLCGPPLAAPCAAPPPPAGPPPPPPPPPVETRPGMSAGSRNAKAQLSTLDIVLIAVADAAFVLLVSACCLLWYVRRRAAGGPGRGGGEKQKAGAGAAGGGVAAAGKGGEDSKEEYSSAQEPEHNKLVFFQGGQLTFDLEDLLRASAEVLGKGSFGTAYKAVLEDGPTVVVKRLKEVSVGRKEFEQQMDSVGKLRHRHLVPMRAYYYSKEEKLLVHEYLPLGSLSAALHGVKSMAGDQAQGQQGGALDWERRLRIGIAAAKGVAHLHASGAKFVHGDIKSSNVLLHAQYDACISDFGLTPLFTPNAVASRMVGYRAPEVAETRKITHKSDVYSFGVVLLELLTGKAPSQTSAEEGMDLPRWVQSVVREEWTSEVFDKELMKYENIEEDMVQMLQIALTCVSTSPDQRPSMAEVLKMIQDVRHLDHGNVLSTDQDQGGGNDSTDLNPLQQSSSTDEASNESAPAAEGPSPPLPPHHHHHHERELHSSSPSTDQSA